MAGAPGSHHSRWSQSIAGFPAVEGVAQHEALWLAGGLSEYVKAEDADLILEVSKAEDRVDRNRQTTGCTPVTPRGFARAGSLFFKVNHA